MNEKTLIENALQSAIPEVIASLKNQLIASLDQEIEKAAKEQIVGYVTGWMEENFIPVIGSKLMNLKGVFESRSEEFCKEMADSFFNDMIGNFKKNMEHSWKRPRLSARNAKMRRRNKRLTAS